MAQKGIMQKTAKKLKKGLKTGLQPTNKAGFVTNNMTTGKKGSC